MMVDSSRTSSAWRWVPVLLKIARKWVRTVVEESDNRSLIAFTPSP